MQAVQAAKRRVHQRDELRQRCDDRADQLTAEHVHRRQGRESVDLLAREGLTLEDPAAHHEHVGLLGLRRKRLRDCRGIAARLDERDRGRPFEHHEERFRSRFCRRAPGKRVLDDPKARAVLEQVVAEGLELLVREPSVVGDDQRLRRFQLRRQLGDDLFFVGFQHVVSSSNDETRTRRVPVRARTPSGNRPRLDLRLGRVTRAASCLRRISSG